MVVLKNYIVNWDRLIRLTLPPRSSIGFKLRTRVATLRVGGAVVLSARQSEATDETSSAIYFNGSDIDHHSIDGAVVSVRANCSFYVLGIARISCPHIPCCPPPLVLRDMMSRPWAFSGASMSYDISAYTHISQRVTVLIRIIIVVYTNHSP